MPIVLIVLIAAVAGFILGTFAGAKYRSDQSMGDLNIIEDPEDGAYLFLNVGCSMEELSKMNYATFRILNNNRASRE